MKRTKKGEHRQIRCWFFCNQIGYLINFGKVMRENRRSLLFIKAYKFHLQTKKSLF